MSRKVLDTHNRWRSKTVSLRMSPQENRQLDIAVRLSGLTKQDYIIHRLLGREIVVQGNPRVYKALRDQMTAVLDELKRLDQGSEVNDELQDVICWMTETMNGMKGETNEG